jgi:hypothetical protein
VLNLAFSWSDPADDLIMAQTSDNILNRAIELAKSMGLDHRYIYQNYASGNQDVFGGYGEENREKLRKIQKKYDPEGIFMERQPGYFKL